MAKAANQKLKILYLMKILTEQTDCDHGLSLAEIITELSRYDITAERKSLYDDLKALCTYGLDIEMKRDKTISYYVAQRDFELPELKLLVDAVQSSKFITHKKSTQLIKKIEGLAGKYDAQQLQRQVFVTNRIKTMNESIYYAVDNIHTAIGLNVMISFQYFDWNEKKEKQLRHDGKIYRVSPWALTWDDENYYMVAYDSDAGIIKHYRVDKMLKINVLDCKREGAEIFGNFDIAVYSKKTFGMFGGKDEYVTFLCSNRLAGVIIDRFGRDVSMCPVDSEHFEVSVNIAVSPLFLTWIMNFGADIKVISPQSVIDRLVEVAQATVSQYSIVKN